MKINLDTQRDIILYLCRYFLGYNGLTKLSYFISLRMKIVLDFYKTEISLTETKEFEKNYVHIACQFQELKELLNK